MCATLLMLNKDEPMKAKFKNWDRIYFVQGSKEGQNGTVKGVISYEFHTYSVLMDNGSLIYADSVDFVKA